MTEQITIRRDGQRPLRFTGVCLLAASDSWDTARGDYSGQTGIQHKARVYQHSRGYVVELVTQTQWLGARDSHQAWPCKTAEEAAGIIEAHTPSHLADELLADLDVYEDLDNATEATR